jgi:uncharacterized protein (TIGR00251 family)
VTLEISRLEGAVEFAVQVHPRSPRTEVGGAHAGALRIRVHAAPVEGHANEAVRKAVARVLGVRAADVEIVSGLRGRRKRLRVMGDPPDLADRLISLAEAPRAV